MRKSILILFAFVTSTVFAGETLTSGDVSLIVQDSDDGKLNVVFSAYGQTYNSDTNRNPTLFINCNDREFYP